MASTRILCKDGGFGTQITLHVGQAVDGDPLWSARFNATNPAAVINTHLDFLRNGADLILTNTYQASVEGYVEHLQLSVEQSIELIKKTVRLAHTAKEQYLQECLAANVNVPAGFPMIIASIGPYGTHLHDASEYTGNYADNITRNAIKNWHRVRIDACIEAGVDALALETIPCQMEAEVLVEMLCQDYPAIKFWVSFQCKDDQHLAHGEVFAEAALSVWHILQKAAGNAIDNCLAIGVNCTQPKHVTALFTSLNGQRSNDEKIPLVVYPNSGEIYDNIKGWRRSEHCIPLQNYVAEWSALGAKIIGGCCRTYASDIGHISEAVKSLNKVTK